MSVNTSLNYKGVILLIKDTNTRIQTTISKEDMKIIEKISNDKGISKNTYIRMIIKEFIKQNKEVSI